MFMQVYNNTNQQHPAADEPHDHRHPGKQLHADRRRAKSTSSPTGRAWSHPKTRSRCPARSPTTTRPRGSLLLYKIQIVSLDNRPLELKIVNPENPSESASAELDV